MPGALQASSSFSLCLAPSFPAVVFSLVRTRTGLPTATGRSDAAGSSAPGWRAFSHAAPPSSRFVQSAGRFCTPGVEFPESEDRIRSARETVFLERTTEGIVRQTNIGTVSKATFGGTSERRGGAYMGFSERIDTILN